MGGTRNLKGMGVGCNGGAPFYDGTAEWRVGDVINTDGYGPRLCPGNRWL